MSPYCKYKNQETKKHSLAISNILNELKKYKLFFYLLVTLLNSIMVNKIKASNKCIPFIIVDTSISEVS